MRLIDADVHLGNCPLHPVPEKLPLQGDVSDLQKMLEEMRRASWNACIDAIAGE